MGMYWIDPNGGDANDAIEVYCNVKKQETCIYAKPSKVYRGEYRPKAGTTGDYKWFSSDLRDGHAFTYKADSSQMRFMRFKSSQGSQSITYHCKNSVAVLDASTNSYEKALRLLGDNDVEITHNGSHGKSYTVNSDGCQHSKSNRRWSTTKSRTTDPTARATPSTATDASTRRATDGGRRRRSHSPLRERNVCPSSTSPPSKTAESISVSKSVLSASV